MPDSTSFTRKVLIVFGIFAAGIILLLLLHHAAHLLLLVFGGALIAAFWMGIARWLMSKTDWSYGAAVTSVILVCFALFAGLLLYLGPVVAKQFDDLLQQIPTSLSALQDRIGQYKWSEELFSMAEKSGQLMENPQKIVSQVVAFLGTAFGMLLDVVLVLALAIFIAADPKMYRDGIVLLFPKSKRSRISHTLSASSYTLFAWLVGRLIDMTVLGIATGVGLWLLGFDLALALGILTAILCLIPNIGPILSAIPPILLALTHQDIKVWWVIALYVLIQTAESYLLTPFIQKKAVEMPPALLLTAQVLFATLLGGLGLLLATPIVAVVLVLVKMLYIEDLLDTRHPPMGEEKISPQGT